MFKKNNEKALKHLEQIKKKISKYNKMANGNTCDSYVIDDTGKKLLLIKGHVVVFEKGFNFDSYSTEDEALQRLKIDRVIVPKEGNKMTFPEELYKYTKCILQGVTPKKSLESSQFPKALLENNTVKLKSLSSVSLKDTKNKPEYTPDDDPTIIECNYGEKVLCEPLNDEELAINFYYMSLLKVKHIYNGGSRSVRGETHSGLDFVLALCRKDN